jgi:hypothetical protein
MTPALGLAPAYQMSTGYVSTELRWPGREADHSPQSRVEVKNEWSSNSISHPSELCGA